MSTAVAPERQFKTYRRGEIREDILASWRVHLRNLTNPDTQLPFTETEIATATAEHSRYWIESDAIDLAMLGSQSNALYMADQVRVQRAGTSWLENFHGIQWREPRLDAVGGSGTATQRATLGTVIVGSTTVPDPVAYVVTAPDGKRFQNLYTATATATGAGGAVGATLTLKGVDTGSETNVEGGTKFTPADNIPAGVTDDATAVGNFSGGAPRETDAQWAQRIADQIAHKPASGNPSHIRTFARRASSAVEDAFIYSAALHAGTTIVCITQKRAGALGPQARIPSASTLQDVISFLTPPGSPVMPAPPFFVILPPDDQTADAFVSLAMKTNRDAGWADLVPWPNVDGGTATTVTNVTDPTHFQVTIPAGTAGLPTGVSAPAMMVWDIDSSSYESLDVTSVVLSAGVIYDVVLGTAPTHTIALADVICPDTELRDTIAGAAEDYFDSLGPGEVIDLTSDTRAHRAFRFPTPDEQFPQDAGSGIQIFLQDALGAALASSVLDLMSTTTPAIPTSPLVGPRLIIMNKLGVYAL